MLGDIKLPNRLADLPVTLKGMREKRGWSQMELAKMTKIPRASLACIESGHRMPSVDVLWKLLGALSNGHGLKKSR